MYCGKQIDQRAYICPFCGADLVHKVKLKTPESTLPEKSQARIQPPVIIQQAPKPNIWAQLGAWILQQIVFFVIISAMAVFWIVMMLVFVY